MVYWEDWTRPTGVGILLGLGWILVVLNTIRAIHSDASLSSQVVGIAIPLALALVLFAGAVGIIRYGLLEYALLIAAWTVLGTAAVTVATALNIVGFDSVQPDFSLALFMIVNAAGGGAVLGFLIGLYDAHQHLEREGHVQEERRASALSQRLSVLNRVLRHDIRTQAQIISGVSEQWQTDSTADEELVERLSHASERLTELSMEAQEMQALLGGEQLDREVVDLVTVVRDVGETVQRANPLFSIEYDLPEEQPVHASPLLDRAIKHLLTNAVEHNTSDDPAATVTVRTTDSSTLPVQLTIAHNRPGMPDHERLPDGNFEESQLHHSKGVGLWFATWIVDESQGELAIETPSEDETGTVVTLELPEPPR